MIACSRALCVARSGFRVSCIRAFVFSLLRVVVFSWIRVFVFRVLGVSRCHVIAFSGFSFAFSGEGAVAVSRSRVSNFGSQSGKSFVRPKRKSRGHLSPSKLGRSLSCRVASCRVASRRAAFCFVGGAGGADRLK